ncbi:MAG: aminotransferase class III-fold pyridoxal phosphate-dependent enzyme [Patescibacteria group bacterium]
MKSKKGIELWKKAKKIIPGGNQLLSKRAEMFLPDQWPAYYSKAKGIEVWDLDGNKYLDFTNMAVGACILGYADPDVNKAVKKVVDGGSVSTLNPPEEVELAEMLCRLHPWAEMARYARTGGEAMVVAVRIARAASGKDKVAFCGYHGWHDWYLSANLAKDKNLDGHLLAGLEPRGVPRGLQGTALPFTYNHPEELEKIMSENKDIGVIVLEPLRHQEPQNNFLQKVRKIADQKKAVLVFDEISIGWRVNGRGVHMNYNVYPDIAVFGKTISNGYPMAAIIGRKKVMDAAQQTFISSSYWTERIGPVASLATLKKIKEKKVPAHIKRIGKMIGDGWIKLADKHNLRIKIDGPEALITFSFDYDAENQLLRTIFIQEMLKRGFLAGGSVYVSLAHTDSSVKKYLEAVDKVFALLKKGLEENNLRKILKGPIAHSGFQRLT